MNSDINIRNTKSAKMKEKNFQKLIFYIKFYFNVIKIQRIYKIFKANAKAKILKHDEFPKNVNFYNFFTKFLIKKLEIFF